MVAEFDEKKWFEMREKENKQDFVIRRELLKGISTGNVVEETLISTVKEQLEDRGEFEVSTLRIRLMFRRLTVRYGCVVKDENGLLSLTESGKKMLQSSLMHNEKLIGNYVYDLIMDSAFISYHNSDMIIMDIEDDEISIEEECV